MIAILGRSDILGMNGLLAMVWALPGMFSGSGVLRSLHGPTLPLMALGEVTGGFAPRVVVGAILPAVCSGPARTLNATVAGG